MIARHDASSSPSSDPAAIAPLEAAIRIDPTSRTALGLENIGYAYAMSGDSTGARRMRARVESMPDAPGSDVAIARIAIGLRDTNEALEPPGAGGSLLADPFFATGVGDVPDLRFDSRQCAILGVASLGRGTPPRVVAMPTCGERSESRNLVTTR